jgi:hypothetical protein
MPRLLTIGGLLVTPTAALFAGSAAIPATRRDLRRHGRVWHAAHSGTRVHRQHIWTSNVFFGRVR